MNITPEYLQEVKALTNSVIGKEGSADTFVRLMSSVLLADAIHEIDNTLASIAKAVVGRLS